ncbi:MAG: transposase [Bacteroidota bacterium]
MNTKRFSNKPIRLQNFDYHTLGAYFVTICTANKEQNLSSIENNQSKLSVIGHIVEQELNFHCKKRTDTELGEYVIMPDHVHTIIWIVGEEGKEMPNYLYLPHTYGFKAKFSKSKASLGTIINHFKGGVTKSLRNAGFTDFKWQPRFYDRIIRNQKEYMNTVKYIRSNPKEWNNP